MKRRDRASTPLAASIGENSRKRQEMISLKKPKALQLLDFGIAEAGKLDALCAHERRNPQSHPAAKRNGPRLGKKRRHARLRA